MRRFGLLAASSVGLFACASLLGDFTVDPAETTPTTSDGGDAPSNDDGSVTTDGSPPDASPDGPAPSAAPVPVVVAANQYATCATVVYGQGTPAERPATFCWGAQNLGAPEYLGALPGDPKVMGFARPRRPDKTPVEHLTFDQLYGAGSWFFGRVDARFESAGIPFAWGANGVGQAAVDGNPRPPHVAPTLLAPKTGHKRITGGGAAPLHGCFIDDRRYLHCWGQNDSCEVRSGPTCGAAACNEASIQCPAPAVEHVVAFVEDQTEGVIGSSGDFEFHRFAGGLEHSCVVLSKRGSVQGGIVCWGGNLYRQASPNDVPHVSTPTGISLSSTIDINDVELAAGANHTCTIVAKGSLVCWGRNNSGQAAPVPSAPPPTVRPTEVQLPSTMKGALGGLALSRDTSCFVTKPEGAPSRAVCFGGGALGRAPADISEKLAFVADIEDVQQIAAGSDHACAIARGLTDPPTEPYSLFCWGDNSAKQVDPNGTAPTYPLPHRVELPRALP